jgi:glycine hydroxymethyltransferase
MSDPIFAIIDKEQERQQNTLMLIPSENYASKDVMNAVGSVLMNKYAEGRAGKRYYQGNQYIDEIERLCIERALKAFAVNSEEWGVCVQAHSGGVANFAVLSALVPIPNGRILSMYLPDGGHLSHGWQLKDKKIHVSSKIWDINFYHTDEKTRVFDYDAIRAQALECKPHVIISGGTATPREINHKRMAEIAHEVGAYYMADIAHEAGLVVGKVNTSPFPYADVVTMTTHKTLRGPRGALIFARKENDIFAKIDAAVFPGLQGGPHMHSIAGIAVALREAMQPEFTTYANQVIRNAQVLANELLSKGFDIVTGGTDKHLILVDLRNKDISGWVVANALEVAGIIANRNTVPQETASPFYPSGLRLGTPAVTTRGMKETEMKQIATWITTVVEHISNEKLPTDKQKRTEFVKDFQTRIHADQFLLDVAREVKEFCGKYPIYE